jgi:spermidine/putrescine transport system substrate-binding protein
MDFKTYLHAGSNRRAMLKGMGVAAVGFSLTGALAGCGEKEAKKLANGEEAKLNFYNWDTYIGETTLEDYKDSGGVDVNMTLFASNDELFAKLRAGNQGYDVIVPSNDFVERMAAADMLVPLDQSQIPNFAKNVAPEFKDVPYDPMRKYSMPYTWLVLGIGYRKSKVSGVPDSWKVLFDSDEYKGRIAVLSEAGDMFRLYGKYLGKSVNGLTDADLKTIEAMMIKQKPFIKAFHEDNGQDMLLKGEVDVVRNIMATSRRRWSRTRISASSCPRKAASLIRIIFAFPRARRIRKTHMPSSTICSMPRPGRRLPRPFSTQRRTLPPRR